MDYTHYGIDVKRWVVTSFRDSAKANGITFTELPVSPDLDIVRYEHKGSVHYALIRPLSIPGDYAEAVYITSQTPDDCDWCKLVKDVEAQVDGAAPMPMQSRLKMVIDLACKEASSHLNNNPFSATAETESKEFYQAVYLYLVNAGYDKHRLSALDAPDVDPEFMENIINCS